MKYHAIKKNYFFNIFINILVVSTVIANGFQQTREAVKQQLQLEGYPTERLNPETQRANQLRSYLMNSCLYHEKAGSYGQFGSSFGTSYKEWILFYPTGEVIIRNNSAVYGQWINPTNDSGSVTGFWDVFHNTYDQIIVISLVNGMPNGILLLNSFDQGAISFYINNQLTRYRRLPLTSC